MIVNVIRAACEVTVRRAKPPGFGGVAEAKGDIDVVGQLRIDACAGQYGSEVLHYPLSRAIVGE